MSSRTHNTKENYIKRKTTKREGKEIELYYIALLSITVECADVGEALLFNGAVKA